MCSLLLHCVQVYCFKSASSFIVEFVKITSVESPFIFKVHLKWYDESLLKNHKIHPGDRCHQLNDCTLSVTFKSENLLKFASDDVK